MKLRPLDKSALCTSQAAAYLGVSPSTLKRWADAGHLPFEVTPGGHRRFAVSQLKGFSRRSHPIDALISKVVDGLLDASVIEMEASLLAIHRESGSWARALDRYFFVGAELERRLQVGALTSIQCRRTREVYARALTRFLAAPDARRDRPEALLVATGDQACAPILLSAELVIGEVGWRTRWAGDAGIEELRAELTRQPADMLVVVASRPAADHRASLALAAPYDALARELGCPLGAVTFPERRAETPTPGLCESWQGLCAWVTRAQARRPRVSKAPPLRTTSWAEHRLDAAAVLQSLEAQEAALGRQVKHLVEVAPSARGEDLRRRAGAALDALREHLRTEQKAMQLYSYPRIEEHLARHSTCLSRAEQWCAAAGAGVRAAARAFTAFSKRWYLKHVLVEDRDFLEFLRAHGAPSP